MKIKALHTYQYVRFQNKNENFMTAKLGMEDLQMELLDNGLVSIKTATDHILVGMTNIAYLVPLTPETSKKDMTNRGKLADITPSSPRKA